MTPGKNRRSSISTDVIGSIRRGAQALAASVPLIKGSLLSLVPREVAEKAEEALGDVRPIEELLRDPLSEIARKERRSLLGVSLVAILVARTGLIPQKVESLGITFTVSAQTTLLHVFTAVVVYYAVAFLIYGFEDWLRYFHAVYRGREELRLQRHRAAERADTWRPLRPDIAEADVVRHEPIVVDDASWSLIRLVSPASIIRGIFDFLIPLVIAGYAIYSLQGAAVLAATKTTLSPPTPWRDGDASGRVQRPIILRGLLPGIPQGVERRVRCRVGAKPTSAASG